MKRYLIHQIGEESKIIRADTCTIDGEPREIRFFRGAEIIELLYLHALRRPVRELPDDRNREEEDEIVEPSVAPDW
jgi:hypothetical protein